VLEMDDLNKAIGERLKKTRELRGLKQNRVARKLGIHNSTLSKYESGEREIDNETLLRLADMYDVPAQWIMTGEKEIRDSDMVANEDLKFLNEVKKIAAKRNMKISDPHFLELVDIAFEMADRIKNKQSE